MTQIVVDARGLMPPEPLELTMTALGELKTLEDEVLLLLYREPFPLYGILDRNGYRHHTESTPDGTFHIHIRRAA